ncbi:DUF6263 family protein [Pedobacter sp. Du54]|uniref:DUF6263 family protein n=1 Tax=Pedobacter anseongensis TaxID=3133439 RepID=UPI0030A38372
MKKATILLLILIYSSYCQAQKETIELNLIKGETYRQNMVADMSIGQSAGGQEITIKMQISGKTAYKVLNIIDTVYDIEVRYESLAMKMDMPGGGMTIDSEKENTDDVISKVLAGMKKHPFQIKISKSGKVIEVKNIEYLFSAFNEFPDLPAAQKEQIKKQLSDSYGEKSFKNNLEISLSIFPSKPVSKGEHWVVKGKLESGMSAEMETTYELKEITSDYYLLTSIAKITSSNDNVFVERNGMQIKSDLNGTTAAEIKIDKKTGWIIYSKTNQQFNGTSTIKANDAIPDGMTLPIKMNNVITISNQ